MLKRPVIAIHLAILSNAWAAVEAITASVLEWLVSMPLSPSGVGTLDPFGVELYGYFKSDPPRWELIRILLGLRFSGKDFDKLAERFERVKTEVAGARGLRNDLVHAIYGIDSDDGDFLIKTKSYMVLQGATFRPRCLINVEYVSKVIEIVKRAQDSVMTFEMMVKRLSKKS